LRQTNQILDYWQQTANSRAKQTVMSRRVGFIKVAEMQALMGECKRHQGQHKDAPKQIHIFGIKPAMVHHRMLCLFALKLNRFLP
jgi:hypothetical protein